ncbi:unnamed protein product, partial [Rotaria sordida]
MVTRLRSPLFPLRINEKSINYILLLIISDLQTINITLRILYRARAELLPKFFTNLGLDYEERVLPLITNEILKSVVQLVLIQH